MLVFSSRARRRGRPRKKVTMIAEINTLPPLVFGEPSEFRELMVALIMSGAKTGSSNLRVAYEMTGEALPTVGTLYALVDSGNTRVAVIEILEVVETTVPEVTLELAGTNRRRSSTGAPCTATTGRPWFPPSANTSASPSGS